jgi:CheY-like chemotaxis protein
MAVFAGESRRGYRRLEEAVLEATTRQKRPRALLVDDDPIVLAVLSSLLGELGVECLQAPDGRSGLRRLAEDLLDIDLLVTDLSMPDLPGDALVMAVRELGGERDLPIVVASSFLDEDRAEALRVAGADAVVDKSKGLGPVAAAARRLLAARGQLEQMEAERPASTSTPLFRIELTKMRH